MTAPKRVYRKRRTGTRLAIPKKIQQWFAGELPKKPITAMAYPFYVMLPTYWKAWKESHPDALPPDGLNPLEKHPAWLMEAAEKCLMKNKK